MPERRSVSAGGAWSLGLLLFRQQALQKRQAKHFRTPFQKPPQTLTLVYPQNHAASERSAAGGLLEGGLLRRMVKTAWWPRRTRMVSGGLLLGRVTPNIGWWGRPMWCQHRNCLQSLLMGLHQAHLETVLTSMFRALGVFRLTGTCVIVMSRLRPLSRFLLGIFRTPSQERRGAGEPAESRSSARRCTGRWAPSAKAGSPVRGRPREQRIV